ncbi:unnamed protein product [Parascedosporium putredinis]|uniref:DUF1996 domain-containing protein n=1 Tax=Parascedosporium putredinis TaxID=1442378 RepID=A0A9P1HCN6_9PEZI|nr:unnamed protein product [Parascedosporium putredinis]CAI8005021.1 unnamed protein product [Parascedosporium putredinis]
MKLNTLIPALGLAMPTQALLRFGCSQLSVQRVDPLVNPGQAPSPHLHQIIGGNSFNISMDAESHDLAALSTCTTCQFTEDLSNYWTAVLFFRSKNGTFKRVPQIAQSGMEGTQGGMVVYYMSDALFDTAQRTDVTAFKPGFRMLLGIMANHRFPTCWDGVNLDSANHQDHVAYPEVGTFESGGKCPDTHPVRIPQLMLETVWETSSFNNPADWPEDGSQPFVWSSGDPTGYSNHADYMFGWKDDSLQRAMDAHSYVSAPGLKTQSIAEQNKCKVESMVNEDIDGWLTELPGGMPVL